MNGERGNDRASLWSRIIDLYVDGFRNMTVGRTLWIIILIKLFIIFAVLKLFFFPDFLSTRYSNDQDRAQHVRNELMRDK